MSPLIKPVYAFEQWWLTDTSRIQAGHHCKMDRFLTYHAGPRGTGLKPKGLSVPLVGGGSVHACLQSLLERTKELKHQIPDEGFIRERVEKEQAAYKALVEQRGFQGEQHQERVTEQSNLMAALVYGYYRISLPVLLEEFEILEVEKEQETLLEPRTLLLTRPDALLRDLLKGEAVKLDFKTSSGVTDSYVEGWKNSPQMMAGMRAAAYMLGEPVTQFYLHVLVKGKNEKEFNPETGERDGPKRQNSFLVWPYFKAGNPPMVADEWAPFYRSPCLDYNNCTRARDKKGKPHNHDLGKGWEKRIHPNPWEWVMGLPKADVAKAFMILGPYQENQYKTDQYLRGLGADEEDWIARVGKAREVEAQHTTLERAGWETAEYQETLDRLFPRSYDCDSFYGSACPMKNLCFKAPGWEEPLSNGYVERVPHHEQEVASWKAQGIKVGEGVEVEEE